MEFLYSVFALELATDVEVLNFLKLRSMMQTMPAKEEIYLLRGAADKSIRSIITLSRRGRVPRTMHCHRYLRTENRAHSTGR